MNYQNHYNLLISRGKSRILEDYSEKHHIIPKCIGGDNSDENLVRLTPEEHYLAHQLLVKIYPGNHKLVYAANMMTFDSHGHRQNNKSYGWLRRKCSIAISETLTGRTKETNDSIRRSSEKRTGRTKETHEYLRRSSEKQSGRTKENDPSVKLISEKLTGRTKETHIDIKRRAEKQYGRTKETHEYLRLMSEKKAGRTKETYSGIKLQSEKMSGRTKENDPGMKAMSEKLTGRTKETHKYIKRLSEKLKKLTNEQELLLYTMRIDGIPGKRIQEYFKLIGINLGYSSISSIFQRVKQEKIK